MFIIVPKRGKRTHAVNQEAVENERGPVRTTTACDSCRIKKQKCNGQQPCGSCQRKRLICVYSRPAQQEQPLSAAQATLLQHQQQRLITAVQQMASTLAKYESGIIRPPSSFNVPELLDKYAPQHVVDEQEPPSLDMNAPRARKRRLDEPNTLSPFPALSGADSNLGVERGSDPQFEIQPAPRPLAAGAEHSDQAYDAMTKFLRSMSSGATAPNTSGFIPEMQSSDSSALNTPVANTSFDSTPQGALPFDIMDLVDWDLSLQNLQNPQDFLFGDIDGSFDNMPTDNGFHDGIVGDTNAFDSGT